MSRWSAAVSRRGGRRPAVGQVEAERREAVGAPPVEEIDGLLLLRAVEDDSFPLGALAEVARALRGDEDLVTVVVGSADAQGTAAADHWSRLGALLDSLRSKGTRRVRLVMSGAGDDRPDRPCVARRIADAWELEVTAPDGPVLIAPGGALFVQGNAGPGRGWWRFAPGEAPRNLGPRAPVPVWQEALGRVPARTAGGCVVEQIPAGVLMRPAEAPEAGPGDLCFAVPVDLERPTVLVGAPRAEDVAADEVAAVLAALPAAQRSHVRLAPGGRRDLLRLGQSVADLLGGEVEVLTGLPLLADHAPPGAAPRPTLVGADGRPNWQPFVSSVACRPADGEGRTPAPRLVSSHPPDWIPDGTEPGTVRLTDRWQATVTRAGLALWEQGGPRPALWALAVDPDICAIELGLPGVPLDESVLPALSRLLVGLGADARARAVLLVRGRLTRGEGELRRLAAERGVAAIRYVTAGPAPRPGPAPRRPGTVPVPPAGVAAAHGAPLVRRVPPSAATLRRLPPGAVPAPGPRRPVPGPTAPPVRLAVTSGETTGTGTSTPDGTAPVPASVPVATGGPREGESTSEESTAPSGSAPAAAATAVGGVQPQTEPRGAAPVAAPHPAPRGPEAGAAGEEPAGGDGGEGWQPAPVPGGHGDGGAAEGRVPVPGSGGRALPLPVVPGHVSGAAERAAFRDFAAASWEGHAAAVSRVLTRMPALRGRELDAARTDLIAARAYLTTEEGPLHQREVVRDLRAGEGRLLPYAGCLASALRRLPSYRGVALRGGDAAGSEPGTGTQLRDPAPVSALTGASALPSGAPVRYAIWSVTGRKVRSLLDRPTGSAEAGEEIVFVPGTGFRVLGVRTGPGDCSVVLLRELPGLASVYMDGAEELSALDLKALAHLEAALAQGFPVGDSPGWPERCTGPVGQDA
ncbi:hypothetical protein ABZ721_05700 [Streptomyces sp. NPDC006733]|uniref:hypothetical protein n=1 Tax=Streptomyces sp. NPDC006733 TaxID=3155460 RepID=UPI0034043170